MLCGMRVVSFGAIKDNKSFRQLVKDAAETLTIDGIKLGSFTSDGDLIENKWKENPNGEGYRSRISSAGSPDLLGWTRDVLAPRIQAVFNEFSSRYGWGDPGQVDRLFGPEDSQQAPAEEVNEPSFSQRQKSGQTEAQKKAPVGQPGKQAMPDSTQPFAGAVSSERDTFESLPDTLGPNNTDINFSRRQKDSWLLGRDEVGRINFGAGAKAYDAVAALANRVLDVVKLKLIPGVELPENSGPGLG